MPLGTLIGEYSGWRSLFLLLAGLALLSMPLVSRWLPDLPGAPGVAPSRQWAELVQGKVFLAHAASMLQMTGQFTLYTYIVPFLVRSMGLSKTVISPVLLVYGIGGILGAVVGGRAADRWPRPHTFVVFLVLHALAMSVLPLATVSLRVL